MDWVSVAIGFGSGLVITLVRETMAWRQKARTRELDNATALGEVRVGLAYVQRQYESHNVRLDRIEAKVTEVLAEVMSPNGRTVSLR